MSILNHGLVYILITMMGAAAPDSSAQSSNLLVQEPTKETNANNAEVPGYDPASDLHAYTAFTVIAQEPTAYVEHDLIQIIVRETSTANSKQETSTAKDFKIKGDIKAFPQLTLNDFLDAVLKASANANPAKLDVSSSRDFEGEGEYKRADDFSAKVMAEVIEVLPNGQLVLEARSHIETDEEHATLLLSGRCDPQDITSVRTIQSSQLFDLRVIKEHEGELKDSTKKGFLTNALETIFAF